MSSVVSMAKYKFDLIIFRLKRELIKEMYNDIVQDIPCFSLPPSPPPLLPSPSSRPGSHSTTNTKGSPLHNLKSLENFLLFLHAKLFGDISFIVQNIFCDGYLVREREMGQIYEKKYKFLFCCFCA